MPVVKAHCYWVNHDEGTHSEIASLLKTFAENATTKQMSVGPGQYLISEASWHEQKKAFTASVFKIRSSSLPAAVNDDGVDQLPIPSNTNLGESMCFAYYPEKGAAIVHYAHNGPRHSVIAPFLSQIGFAHPLLVEPILRTDMVERLNNTSFVKSLTFAIHNPQDLKALKKQGGSVSHALDAMKDLNGVNIRIEISVGREKRGLVLDAAKSAAKGLLGFGDTEVTTLQLNAAEEKNQKCEKLDLLNARIQRELTVADSGRELDRIDCQKKLLAVFDALWPDIEKQKP